MRTERISSVAELRGDIDRGLTGDKVAVLDPAAVPLGTDEEAAGTPVDPAVIFQVRSRELEQGQQVRHAARVRTPETKGATQWVLIAAFILALAAMVWLGIQHGRI